MQRVRQSAAHSLSALSGPLRDISGNRRPFGSLSDDRATFRGGGIRGYELFVIELLNADSRD